ncbi:MAG: hypothetical protein J5I94_13860 [Phaeodactylibacter sp.]|nr:hypothetical protein [Phaeodactylibacter sp.]
MRPTITISFLLFTFLMSCTTPREAFDNQDYEKAFQLALASLNKDKGGREEKRILQQSLEEMLEREGAESRRSADSDDPEDWKSALSINNRLQDRVKQARAFLPDSFREELYTLAQQAQWLRKRLYGHYFEQGRDGLGRAVSTGLKEYAQQAHGAFTKARQYAELPAPQLDSLTNQALKRGIVYYVVETDALFEISYNWEIEQIFGRLEDQSGGFLRVVVNEPLKNADCALTIRFGSMEADIQEDTGDQDFNREIIVDYEIVTDTAGNETRVPVYDVVEGNATIITRTKTVEWEAEAAIDALTPNCNLSSQGFSATTRSVAREARTSGDERAIPEEYLDAPSEGFREEDDMVEDLLQDLYEQVVRAYF